MNKEEIAKSIDEGLKILKQEPSFVFNMEEIKAIDHFSNYPTNWDFCFEVDKRAIDTILGLISKLQKELDSQKQGNKDLVKEGVKLSAKIVELEKELEQEKEKKKKLNLENQALFESINCNDDNMLARRYSNLQKESDKKDKVIDLMAKQIDKYKEIIDDLSEGNIDCFIPNSFSNIDDCIKKETCYECIKEYFYKKVEEENV